MNSLAPPHRKGRRAVGRRRFTVGVGRPPERTPCDARGGGRARALRDVGFLDEDLIIRTAGSD
jgi:hypothetical protein